MGDPDDPDLFDDAECVHGLGPVEACVECNGRAQRERLARVEDPSYFPAKYDGFCMGCHQPIAVGQMIAYLPDRPVTHEECWT